MIRKIKSRRMRWSGHTAGEEDIELHKKLKEQKANSSGKN
jgi:hypothetical protein